MNRKKKIVVIAAIVLAVAIGAGSAFFVLRAIKPSQSASSTVPSTEAEPWSTSYFKEMRGMYIKVESEKPTADETAYNKAVDELNTLLDEYQAAAKKGLEPNKQNEYEEKVDSKLDEIKKLYSKINAPGASRDTFLSEIYELEASVQQEYDESKTDELKNLLDSVTELKQNFSTSRITLAEAAEQYHKYEEEFNKLSKTS